MTRHALSSHLIAAGWLVACSRVAPVVPNDPVDPGPVGSTGQPSQPTAATAATADTASPEANRAPIAEAGDDQRLLVPANVVLDASRSSDPDGDVLSYRWAFAQDPGEGTELVDPQSVTALFRANVDGIYLVDLEVSDGQERVFDQVTVEVLLPASGLVANAGPDQNVVAESQVFLDGGDSYSSAGDPLTFDWTLIDRPAGSAAQLSNPNGSSATFLADLPGTYTAELRVSDGATFSPTDRVFVVATPAGP